MNIAHRKNSINFLRKFLFLNGIRRREKTHEKKKILFDNFDNFLMKLQLQPVKFDFEEFCCLIIRGKREVWFGFECECVPLRRNRAANFKVSVSCQSLTSEGESKKEEEPTNRTLNAVLNCSRTKSWILMVTRKTSKFHAN